MNEVENRRPLNSRDTAWAKRAANWLTGKSITPNQISIAAMGFAAFGCLFFWLASEAGPWLRGICFVLAAAMCQARLICNLLDGMVAVEGGRGTKDGPYWNEAPDRVSDILFLSGAGVAAGVPVLGWAAAAFAVLTAYVRELGRAEGFPPDFSGPMAKQHRMALLTLGAVLAAFEPIFTTPFLLQWVLWAIIIGSALTAIRRSMRLIGMLKAR